MNFIYPWLSDTLFEKVEKRNNVYKNLTQTSDLKELKLLLSITTIVSKSENKVNTGGNVMQHL